MRCKQCGGWFEPGPWWDDDDYGPEHCADCEDIMIARSQKRAEWNAYHDEPCPEVELPPLPPPPQQGDGG